MKSAIKSADDVQFGLEEAWSEVCRELQVRERVYDRWVDEQKLAWADARDRFARMRNAAFVLRAVCEAPDTLRAQIMNAVGALLTASQQAPEAAS